MDGKELHRESLCASEKISGITSTNTLINADTQPLSKAHVFQGPSRECSVLLIIYRWCWLCTKCWCPLLRCWILDFPWLWVCSRMNKLLPKLVILFIWLCKGMMGVHRLQGCKLSQKWFNPSLVNDLMHHIFCWPIYSHDLFVSFVLWTSLAVIRTQGRKNTGQEEHGAGGQMPGSWSFLILSIRN